ncbi:ROK family transcriptional regulator [Streptomyces capparidis]
MSAAGPARGAPATQASVRHRNLALVLHAVAARGEASRAAVAADVGLTKATVSTLVEELITAGLVTELGVTRPGTVGRPGTALALSAGGPAGIGAEVGVDHLAVCAVDLRGRVRARREAESGNRGRDPGEVLADLAGLVRAVTAEAAGAGLAPAGVTVAVPGLVGPDHATVERAPNLGWTRVDAAGLLRRALGWPDGGAGGPGIRVENEANLGALAELWLGGAADRTDFVHVSAEIGIGAALVVEGRLFRGARGFAGELGHVPVRPEGPGCSCGSRGCLETYAGEEAVLRAAGIDPVRAAAEHPGPAGRVRLLAALAEDGDPAARRALRRAGSALGIALSGAVNMLDPQAVVLGGALARLGPWLLPPLDRELRRRVTDRGWRPGSLAVSALGRDGVLLGAAHSVVRAILDDPAAYRRTGGAAQVPGLRPQT